ncbi:MAG: hypothetical protein OXN89_00150 [Bryobacterales bacterium]|nr:hypothetical protein [Bryobacterales bacterium]
MPTKTLGLRSESALKMFFRSPPDLENVSGSVNLVARSGAPIQVRTNPFRIGTSIAVRAAKRPDRDVPSAG